LPLDSGIGFQRRRDGGAGRAGDATATRSWRSQGDEAAARGGRVAARGDGVAARHLLDGDGGLLPSLRRLLTG
ncbi:unnamed protein product, partial [Urochloa humidicola]